LGTLLLIMFVPVPAAFALSIAAVPASALVILVFARGSGSLSSFLSHRWFIALGEASFMLYMVHVLVRRYLAQLISDPMTLALISTVVSVVLSLALFRWFEKPCQRWL